MSRRRPGRHIWSTVGARAGYVTGLPRLSFMNAALANEMRRNRPVNEVVPTRRVTEP